MIIAAKTTSTVLVHLMVAVTVGYVLTGSLAVAGLVALVEPVCNVVALHFHEKAWKRITGRLGRAKGGCLATVRA